MAAEARVDVHHCAPRCLLGLFDAAAGDLADSNLSSRRDGLSRERGPYWYFQYHEGGKRKKLYLGKTSDPEGTLTAKRTNP